MPKPKDAEGFDVAGTRYRQHENALSMLVQAARDYVTPVPSRNFSISVAGDRILVRCNTYEQGMGEFVRLQGHLQAISKLTDEYVRLMKKRVREMGGGTLKLKELKDLRGFDRQKISLNDRWDVTYRRTYELEGLAHGPEEV